MPLIKGTNIAVEVIPADRKTYAIKVLHDGSVELRIPRHMPVREVETILQKHRDWIIKASDKQKARFSDTFSDGAKAPLFGQLLTLADSKGNHAYYNEGVLYLPKNDRVACLTEIYRKVAKEYLPKRLEQLAAAYGFSYQSVKINSAKTRWGSCSGKKRINLSLRTVMLPKECIDYVLVHELCHLRHMDHSSAFWNEVEKILPDYKKREKRIKESFVILL